VNMGECRLVVDVGRAVVRAGLPSDRGVIPVVFDGVRHLPSGVYVAATGEIVTGEHAVMRGLDDPAGYVADPIRYLSQSSITVGERTAIPADLVAAVLRHVGSVAATQASNVPDALTVVVPAGWGPGRRAAVYRAAVSAGLPMPTLVTAPVAAATAVGLPVTPGVAVLVCDVGAAFTATVLEAAGDCWQVLSTVDADDGGGTAVDEALLSFVCQRIAVENSGFAERLVRPVGAAHVRDRMLLLAQIRAAKEAAVGGPVVVATGLPQLSVALDPARLVEVTADVRARAAATAVTAVAAADLEPAQLTAVCCVGASARLPGMVEACAGAANVPPIPVQQPEFAAVVGAAAITPPGRPGRRTRPGWSAVAAVSTALAVGLAPLLLYTALVAVEDERLNVYGMSVHFNYGMYGLACGLLGTACLGGVVLAVTALPAPTISGLLGLPGSLPVRRLPALLVAGSGVAALVLAWVYRLITTAFLEPDPPGLSQWTVLPILPTVLAGVILGGAILVRADDAGLDRLRRVAFPVLPLALAAIGALAYEHARHIALPYKEHWMLYLALRCSAALIGVGAVVLLLAGLRPLVIAIVAVPVAGLTAAVVQVDGLDAVAASYLGAAAWWWLSRAASTSVALLRRPARPPDAARPPSALSATFGETPSPVSFTGHRPSG
jgi:hypothetical protein